MTYVRFGTFMPPYHRITENPTFAFARDLKTVEDLEAMGYDEVWFGEHHSAGEEIYASPELMIAAAAQRTRRIRLATGVSSLPFHNPLILADRIMQLHHMTEGRLIFGVGPGALASDSTMLGLIPERQRDMMDEALGCILRLFRGETVTMKTDWFELVEARLQLRPYGKDPIEVCTAASVSPSGPRAAGKHGTGILMLAARMSALADQWRTACDLAAENDHVMHRANWRICGYVHIAETREQAMRDVEHHIHEWFTYHRAIAPAPLVPLERDAFAAADMVEKGFAVIGTPDDLIAHIEKLQAASGGFGCFLQTDHNWTTLERKMKSYELIANYVMPKIQVHNTQRAASLDWAIEKRESFTGLMRGAIQSQIDRYGTDAK